MNQAAAEAGISTADYIDVETEPRGYYRNLGLGQFKRLCGLLKLDIFELLGRRCDYCPWEKSGPSTTATRFCTTPSWKAAWRWMRLP